MQTERKTEMKVRRMKQLFGGPAVIFLATIILFCGCASTRVITTPYMPGLILLLPPHDLVQNGVAHPIGAGSGQVFQNFLRSKFAGTAFELVTTDSKEFSATEIADKEKGLKEAKRLNADYCLQVVLGEFVNAAPMTFRPDYAYLDTAIMYDVRTGEAVWQLAEPLYLQKGNLGNHLILLKTHAQTVAKSICKNMR